MKSKNLPRRMKKTSRRTSRAVTKPASPKIGVLTGILKQKLIQQQRRRTTVTKIAVMDIGFKRKLRMLKNKGIFPTKEELRMLKEGVVPDSYRNPEGYEKLLKKINR